MTANCPLAHLSMRSTEPLSRSVRPSEHAISIAGRFGSRFPKPSSVAIVSAPELAGYIALVGIEAAADGEAPIEDAPVAEQLALL